MDTACCGRADWGELRCARSACSPLPPLCSRRVSEYGRPRCPSLTTKINSQKLHGRHETARVHHAARRRGGSVAAHGACAAGADASHRIPQQPVAQRISIGGGRVPPSSDRGRLCRGAKCGHRILLGRGAIRSAARVGGRSRSPPSGGDFRNRRQPSGIRGQGSECDNSDRLPHGQRSNQVWSRGEPQPPRQPA